jgi:hypothetical protein
MSKVRKIRVPEVVTGKWIARLIHRSKLRWNGGSLTGGGSYCALGMIAKEAGFSNSVINKVGTPNVGIAPINDNCRSREEVVRAFCNVPPTRKFRLGAWIKRLKERSV